ncbi:alpha/beta hydrolase-fold protein [Colwellia psychrerythraea]|uniref:Esterase n=1 Tax=Colwellia psychrerythraea TaxID=28229 RepID=A0A099KNA0_COLPS|nr:alpha/beta hydrolase-fold protein [Colwellia psychrerythraea]KGJ91695.1 esterase [Colwellia psychrerythraea]
MRTGFIKYSVMGSVLSSLFFISFSTFAEVVAINIAAPSLANAKLDVREKQGLYIYLPSSYGSTNKQYPVMYYLHGYGGNANEASVITNTLDNYILADKAQEMIVVGINGNNQFGGSFYANSPVTGNWRDFVTKDVISYIDNNYRTLAKADYRGIVGYSMGGYAAINIAFKHPDKFKHLFSLSPGLFDEKGLDIATRQWRNEGWSTFMNRYGAAFAYKGNTNNWFDWNETSAVIRTKWASGFGNLPAKVDDYQQLSEPLTSIHIEYGSKDRFTWIPQGSRYLVKLLKNKTIKVN